MDTKGNLEELLQTLDGKELSYVQARSHCNDKKSAYVEAGLSRNWLYGKDEKRREYLDDIAQRLRIDTIFKAKQVLSNNAERAAEVLAEQLEDRRPSVSQKAAIKILEWNIGTPTQKTETKLSGQIETIHVTIEDDD